MQMSFYSVTKKTGAAAVIKSMDSEYDDILEVMKKITSRSDVTVLAVGLFCALQT